jgi:hypothetical protein
VTRTQAKLFPRTLLASKSELAIKQGLNPNQSQGHAHGLIVRGHVFVLVAHAVQMQKIHSERCSFRCARLAVASAAVVQVQKIHSERLAHAAHVRVRKIHPERGVPAANAHWPALIAHLRHGKPANMQHSKSVRQQDPLRLHLTLYPQNSRRRAPLQYLQLRKLMCMSA